MTRATVEESHRIDLRDLCRWADEGAAGWRELRWSDGARIGYFLSREPSGSGSLALWWSVGGRLVDVCAELVTTSQKLGGRRWWVACPRCGRRCAVLALDARATGAGCRVCLRLSYQSQSEGPTDRAHRALRKLRSRYGSNATGFMVSMAKPDRMHWSTWVRVAKREARYQHQGLASVLGGIRRLEARLRR